MNKEIIERCRYQSIFYVYMFKRIPESRHMNALLDKYLPRKSMMNFYYNKTKWYSHTA